MKRSTTNSRRQRWTAWLLSRVRRRMVRPTAQWLLWWLLPFAAGAELNFQQVILDLRYIAYERDVGDIDGDGDNDLVAIQEGDAMLQVFRAPNWTRSTLITFTGTHRYPRADDFKLADLDGDGDLDIVTRLGNAPSSDTAGISVWCENLGGGSNFTQHLIGNSLEYVKDIVVADFDRDRRPDVAMRMNSRTQLWLQEPSGTWTEVLLTHPAHEGMEAGDLDMDGDPDLILNGFWFATPNSPAAARLALNYTNKVIDAAWFNQTGDWTANSCKVVVGDFDSDGTNDAAFSQSERAGDAVAWYRSSAPNGAGPWTKQSVAVVDYCHSLQAADWDLDGDVDLLVGGMTQSQHRGLKLWLNASAGTNWTELVIQTDGSYSAETGDIDSDGDLDIVGIRNWNSAPTYIYRNNASITRAVNLRGPLRVHPTNPRYFTDDGKRAIYLTGSHTWQNLQDGGPPDPPAAFDYAAFLSFLSERNHNFFRLWAWESDRESAWDKRRLFVRPMPYLRTGPGTALDGKPRFDLTRFDPAYFQRLRDRVKAAQDRGLYVGVMLFQGFSVAKKSPRAQGNPWPGHPFHRDNNLNGIDGDPNHDGQGYEVHTLVIPRITALQETYVRKVIETVGQFDNVIYEISNESHGGSTAWQYHLIALIREIERTREKQHPVWMSFQYDGNIGAGVNRTLFESHAEAISPQHASDNVDAYKTDPPLADGSKVILLDTDHLWGIGGDAAWVWKAFTRGLNPIFMDPYQKGSPQGQPRLDPKWDGIRRAMGQTRRLAERVNLAAMTPRNELASSGYCLAHPATEYVVYLPAGGEVTVDLSAAAGELQVEWIHPVEGKVTAAEAVAGGAKRTLKVPFPGPAVVHLTASPAKRGAGMAFPGGDWDEATPESQGVNGTKLKEAVAWLDSQGGPDGAKGLVIVRNGHLIWKGPDAGAYRKVFSCTKVFTSTVLGLLVDNGRCRLDDHAVQFLPSLGGEHPAYARITLRHLASMSGGYRGVVRDVSPEQPWGDPMAYLVPQSPRYESGTACAYHDHDLFLLGNLLTRLARQPLKEVFRHRIANPIRMKQWDWGAVGALENGVALNNAAGTPANNPGIQTTALDLARLGHLYLNRGHWNGRQLLSASFVDQATTNQVPVTRRHATGADPGGHYGFYWWTNGRQRHGEAAWPAAPPQTYAARGAVANACFVVPEWNMVITRLAAAAEASKALDQTWNTFFAQLDRALISNPATPGTSRQ